MAGYVNPVVSNQNIVSWQHRDGAQLARLIPLRHQPSAIFVFDGSYQSRCKFLFGDIQKGKYFYQKACKILLDKLF